MVETDCARAKLLIKQGERHGWTVVTSEGRCTVELHPLSQEQDGNGKRRRLTLRAEADYIGVELTRDGCAVRAHWMRRDGEDWAFIGALRGRIGGEYAPVALSATALRAFVRGDDTAVEAS